MSRRVVQRTLHCVGVLEIGARSRECNLGGIGIDRYGEKYSQTSFDTQSWGKSKVH